MQALEPFRVVGSVCDEVPVSATLLYGVPVLMVATGHTYQLYKGKELALIRGGPTFEHAVAAVAQSGKLRFVAEGARVHAFVHHKPLWSEWHERVTRPHVRLLLAQDELLFCAGADKRIVVRAAKTGAVLQEMLVADSATPTAMALLSGYTNKLLVATAEGALQLYNFRRGVCIWQTTTAARTPSDNNNNDDSTSTLPRPGITALACSAYKDLIAYGTDDGRVVVLNVATDEVVVRFAHSEGAVTALAWRSDVDDRGSIVVSGTSLGEIALWDVAARALDGVLTRTRQVRSAREAHERAHDAAVHSLLPLPYSNDTNRNGNGNAGSGSGGAAVTAAALLISAGADNALLQFRFDTVDGLGVRVRERRGHGGACTVARFYNAELLVSAGADRALRLTHIFSDRASWELTQGEKLGKRARAQHTATQALKLPPATALASCTTRGVAWPSVVSLHTASAQLCAWRVDTRALDFKLAGVRSSSNNGTAHVARAVAMSDCGNFALVGYASGNVVRVSVQNRSVRQFFDLALGAHGVAAHNGAVTCLDVACGNTVVISAGLDGDIKLWDLHTTRLRHTLSTALPMTCACVHPAASLFIVAQHATLRVYDCAAVAAAAAATATTRLAADDATDAHDTDTTPATRSVATAARTLCGHRAAITAVALAPDTHRYVVSAAGDAALLLWDLAAAACVGQYRLPSAALSLHFHPDALFVATTHAGERGVVLWANNLRYGFTPEVVAQPLSRATDTLPLLHFPSAHGGNEDNDADNQATHNGDDDDDDDAAATATEATLFDAAADAALQRRRREAAAQRALDAIRADGLTLSGLPRSLWQSLTMLDQIRQRNVPLLPPKKKDVPFFLPTTAATALRPTFLVVAGGGGGATARTDSHDATAATTPAASDATAAVVSRLQRADVSALTPVQQMLLRGEHDALLAHLRACATPQAIDLEVKRSVDYADDGGRYTADELRRVRRCVRGWLAFVLTWLRRGEEVDLVQGILADVLRSHGALLARGSGGAQQHTDEDDDDDDDDDVATLLQAVAQAQRDVRYRLDHLLSFPACLAGVAAGTLF